MRGSIGRSPAKITRPRESVKVLPAKSSVPRSAVSVPFTIGSSASPVTCTDPTQSESMPRLETRAGGLPIASVTSSSSGSGGVSSGSSTVSASPGPSTSITSMVATPPGSHSGTMKRASVVVRLPSSFSGSSRLGGSAGPVSARSPSTASTRSCRRTTCMLSKTVRTSTAGAASAASDTEPSALMRPSPLSRALISKRIVSLRRPSARARDRASSSRSRNSRTCRSRSLPRRKRAAPKCRHRRKPRSAHRRSAAGRAGPPAPSARRWVRPGSAFRLRGPRSVRSRPCAARIADQRQRCVEQERLFGNAARLCLQRQPPFRPGRLQRGVEGGPDVEPCFRRVLRRRGRVAPFPSRVPYRSPLCPTSCRHRIHGKQRRARVRAAASKSSKRSPASRGADRDVAGEAPCPRRAAECHIERLSPVSARPGVRALPARRASPSPRRWSARPSVTSGKLVGRVDVEHHRLRLHRQPLAIEARGNVEPVERPLATALMPVKRVFPCRRLRRRNLRRAPHRPSRR